jgi:serine/threonine protein kinase
VKLIDFGFSKRPGVGERTLTSCCGSPQYMSPEMLRASRPMVASLPTKHGKYGSEVDVWACGVTMYVLLFGEYPFYDERRTHWHRKILEGKYIIPSWRSGISDECRDLLGHLLDVSAATRYSAQQALGHPWFASFGLFPKPSVLEADTTAAEGCAYPAPGRRKTPPQAPSATGKTMASAQMETAIAQFAAAASGGSHAVAFTPPRNTHRLVDGSPFH